VIPPTTTGVDFQDKLKGAKFLLRAFFVCIDETARCPALDFPLPVQ